MSIRVKHDTFTDSLIMSDDTASPSRITIPCWAMDFITKDYKHEIDQLKDENAKLRELVQDMFEEIEAGGFDPMVERHGKSTVYYEEDPSWRVGIRERVRELKIEVSE